MTKNIFLQNDLLTQHFASYVNVCLQGKYSIQLYIHLLV